MATYERDIAQRDKQLVDLQGQLVEAQVAGRKAAAEAKIDTNLAEARRLAAVDAEKRKTNKP